MDKHLIERKLSKGGNSAGSVFRDILGSDNDAKNMALTVISENPERAIQLLENSNDLGITLMGAANVLDEVVGLIPDQEKANTLLTQNLTPDRLTELLSARGELGSTTAYIVNMDTLIEAILLDATSWNNDTVAFTHKRDAENNELDTDPESEHDGNEETKKNKPKSFQGTTDISPMLLYTLRSWALKIRERDDYEDFLDYKLGAFTIKEFLVLSNFFSVGNIEDISPDMYDAFGIDADEGNELLKRMLESGDMPSFEEEDILQAKLLVSEKRKAREQEASELQRQVTTVADEIEI